MTAYKFISQSFNRGKKSKMAIKGRGGGAFLKIEENNHDFFFAMLHFFKLRWLDEKVTHSKPHLSSISKEQPEGEGG